MIFINDAVFIRAFWFLLNKSFKNQLSIRFDVPFANQVMKLAKTKYFAIMRDTSRIGKNNPKLADILMAAFMVAIYKAAHGKLTATQMESILTDGLESVPLFTKSFAKANHFCRAWQDKRYSQAVRSQKKVYPDDFVCEFIYGDTPDEYGITYYECALYKLLQREGCPELTPAFCKFDYIMAKHMNSVLTRTKTLAAGGDCCDFWYAKRENT